MFKNKISSLISHGNWLITKDITKHFGSDYNLIFSDLIYGHGTKIQILKVNIGSSAIIFGKTGLQADFNRLSNNPYKQYFWSLNRIWTQLCFRKPDL